MRSQMLRITVNGEDFSQVQQVLTSARSLARMDATACAMCLVGLMPIRVGDGAAHRRWPRRRGGGQRPGDAAQWRAWAEVALARSAGRVRSHISAGTIGAAARIRAAAVAVTHLRGTDAVHACVDAPARAWLPAAPVGPPHAAGNTDGFE